MKNKIYKIFAVAFAMTLMAVSPSATITSHAYGFNIDAPEHSDGDGKRPSDMGKDTISSGSDSSNSGSSNGSSSSGSSSGGSSSSGSYDSGASDNGSYGNGGSSYQQTANDVIVSTTGGQKFRNVMNDKHTVYEVYHCGISRVSFSVTDAEGNAVAYSTVKLEQGEDGLWYENITFAEGVDTKGLTLNVTKGDSFYLGTELGVRGIKINGKVVLLTVKTNGFNADAPEHSDGDGKKPSK